MRCRCLVVVTACATVLPAGFATLRSETLQQAAGPFVVAIEQRAGRPNLQPVARYTGAEWVNTWPRPDDEGKPAPLLGQIPPEWLGGPVPLQWTLWSTDGARIPVRVTAAIREPGPCQHPIVLPISGADGAPIAPDPVRVAVNTSQPVEYVKAIAPDHHDAKEIRPLIEREYQQAEARRAGEGSRDWTQDRDALNAARAPITIETLVGPSIDAGPVVYYFRALRRLPAEDIAIEFHGWVSRSTDGAWVTFDTVRQNRGNDGAGLNRPIAIFRVGQRMYWLTMLVGYEWSHLAIDEVARGSVRRLVTTYAGGC